MKSEPSLHDGSEPTPVRPRRAKYRQLRYILPAVVLSALVLAGLLAVAIYWSSYGWIMVFAVPFVGGIVLGYMTEVDHVVLWVVAIMVIFGAIGGLFTYNLAGLLCGAIAAMVIIVPMAVGASMGLLLRVYHQRRELKENRRRAAAGMLLATVGLLWAEAQMPLPVMIEEVRTERILAADAMTAWDSLVFYEEVGAEPPRLAKIGIPYPLGTEGIVDEVGDTKRCLYEGGHLVKLITDFRPGERFAFDIIEQVGIEDRSVELIDGSFEFEEVAPGRTLVTLTTRYRPLLQARAAWRPFEYAVVHVLHDHVLDWMARKVAAP